MSFTNIYIDIYDGHAKQNSAGDSPCMSLLEQINLPFDFVSVTFLQYFLI